MSFSITNESADGSRRVVWNYDDEYTSERSYALDTEEETAKAVAEEEANLESGEWVALFATVQRWDPSVGKGWMDTDSLYGIVIAPDDAELAEFADHSLGLETTR